MHRYLTTKELADLLRLKERKVYDLAASGEIPCTRVTGKLLFPRDAVETWLGQHTERGPLAAGRERPAVFLGSHDPLLEWALREARCGVATNLDSSRDGLERFVAGEGIATGLHILDEATSTWNVAAVAAVAGMGPVVLVEWARRQRGLILAPGVADRVGSLTDLTGLRFVPRQPEAGSQALFEAIARRQGLDHGSLLITPPARSEADGALAVQAGEAEAAFGLQTFAAQYRLGFVPVVSERFDILVTRRAYFEPPMQALFAFCRSEAFRAKAASLTGYDVSGHGTVHFNGAAP